MKYKLKAKYYIRYADDFVFISEDKNYLASIVPPVQEFLQTNLKQNSACLKILEIQLEKKACGRILVWYSMVIP